MLLTAALLMMSGCGGRAANSGANTGTGTSANATGTNSVTGASMAFDRSFERDGIRFEVSSPNLLQGNSVTIKPEGLKDDNAEIKKNIRGQIYDAVIDDLNDDKAPEIYIMLREPEGNRRAWAIGFASDKNRSLKQIVVEDLDPASKDMLGYNGEDEYAFKNGIMTRSFPILEGIGAEAKKSGKTRYIEYKLVPGDKNWELDKIKADER